MTSLGHAVGKGAQKIHLRAVGHKRVHDLWRRRGRARCGDLARRFNDRPNLHLVDLGKGDAQPTPAVAQHGVAFGRNSAARRVNFAGSTPDALATSAISCGEVGRNSWRGGSEQAKRHRQAVEDVEELDEVAPLHGQELGEGGAPAGLVVGKDHLADNGDAPFLEEHVFGADKADALSAELAGGGRIHRRLGIWP